MTEKFPCGDCSQEVKSDENSIACDICNRWFHQKCVHMSNLIFSTYACDETLSWTCLNCGLADISTNAINLSLHNDIDENNWQNQHHTSQERVGSLRLVVCNFQSLWNKRNELEDFLKSHKIDILIGSETHLSKNYENSELLPPGFTAARKDRPDGYGGVILIYRDSLKVEILSHKQAEIISLKIATFEKAVIISSCYRSMNNTEEQNQHLINELNLLCKKHKNSPIWIGGDFNLPDINWSDNSITSHQYTKTLNENFIDSFEVCNINQLVTFPTRKKNTLDLLLSNRPAFLKNCVPIPGFGDHDTAVLADIYCHPQRHKPVQRKILCWNRANIDELKNGVGQAVQNLCQLHTTESPANVIWGDIKILTGKALQQHVPSKVTSKRFNQPWFNQECRRAVRMKIRRYRVYKRHKLKGDWIKFQEAAKQCRKVCNATKTNFITTSIDGNKKKLFKFIKSKRRDISGVSPLLDKQGVVQTSDERISELMNEHYCSVFSNDDGKTPAIKDPQGKEIGNLVFTRNGVIKLLTCLDPAKASGPDNIPTRFLKICANEIADALTLLYNACLKQGKVPDDWKHASISPIFKGGNKSRSSPESYRPVSLTSVPCKVMEHVLHSHIMHHLEEFSTITDNQHGFRKKRSCETQLLSLVDKFAKSINQGEQTDAILLDLVRHSTKYVIENYYSNSTTMVSEGKSYR